MSLAAASIVHKPPAFHAASQVPCSPTFAPFRRSCCPMRRHRRVRDCFNLPSFLGLISECATVVGLADMDEGWMWNKGLPLGEALVGLSTAR